MQTTNRLASVRQRPASRPRRFGGIAGALVVVLLLSSALSGAQSPADTVLRVVDGDTVVLATTGTVRLIGVDTPETVDPREPVQAFGREASAFVHTMLDGQSVRLAYDHQRVDKYRRTLAYLYLEDGTFVNLEIVRQGFGHALLDYPFQYMDRFRAAEREAREAGRGLWAASPAAAQATVSASFGQVWVNTASKVYHCPGTRYYGTTARGTYMTEAEARSAGHRPAGGRSCGPESTVVPSPPPAGPTTRELATAPATASVSEATTVWVNSASRVYHCPGTRYYGRTARGEYMSETAAQSAGHRPAAGRTCGPIGAVAPSAKQPDVQRSAMAPVDKSPSTDSPVRSEPSAGNPEARVWVNTSSRVYHCPGTRYYGATKNGSYMKQHDAQAAGHRPASGRYCG